VGCEWICKYLGVDVDLIGWVGVTLGGTYDCSCGIVYVPMVGVVFYAALVETCSFPLLINTII